LAGTEVKKNEAVSILPRRGITASIVPGRHLMGGIPRKGNAFMGKRFSTRSLLSAMAILLCVLLLPLGSMDFAWGGADEEEVEAKQVDIKLLDLELFDQDGKKVGLRSDVIGDRIAVIDTFFTTCGLICPILSAIFADVQEQLGDRLGKEVALVSITVDPKTDIPPRLKEFAKTWEAKPGWVFLTGSKKNVDRVLQGIDAYTPDFQDHPAMILVGDGHVGGWTRFYGFASPEQIIGRIDELSAKKQARTP
jgi:protein SCO1/2